MTARISPQVEAKPAAMIAAGWTPPSSASELNLSLSTVQRIKKRTNTKFGAVRTKAVEDAKEELLKVMSSDFARNSAAALIRDDFAIAGKIREKLAMLIDSLPDEVDTVKDAATLARTLSAITTSLKLSNDTLRQTIQLASPNDGDDDELPELIIRDMLDEEIEDIRAKQRLDAEDMGLN